MHRVSFWLLGKKWSKLNVKVLLTALGNSTCLKLYLFMWIIIFLLNIHLVLKVMALIERFTRDYMWMDYEWIQFLEKLNKSLMHRCKTLNNFNDVSMILRKSLNLVSKFMWSLDLWILEHEDDNVSSMFELKLRGQREIGRRRLVKLSDL